LPAYDIFLKHTDEQAALNWRNLVMKQEDLMEVKIGIRDNARELEFESLQTSAQINDAVSAALNGGAKTISLTDTKGVVHIVPADALAYIVIGAEETRRVGFIA
jgi:hypothetical protein